LPYFIDLRIAVPYFLVPGDQRPAVNKGLCHDDSVKGIVVIQGQRLDSLAVFRGDGNDINAHLSALISDLRNCMGERYLAESLFD